MKPDAAFASIIFLQGEPALPTLRLLEQQQVAAALDALREFDTGDEQPGRDGLDENQPWGKGDDNYPCGNYVMAANQKLQYVSLARQVRSATR